MKALRPGYKVYLANDVYGDAKYHETIWAIAAVDGDYALVTNPKLGQWWYPLEALRLDRAPVLATTFQGAVAA